MVTVYSNADFISFDAHDTTYSVMVVKGKEIVYLGYNTPICYDNAKVVDLDKNAVIPVANRDFCLSEYKSDCSVLEAGQKADFAVIDKNVYNDPSDFNILAVYIHGKQKHLK